MAGGSGDKDAFNVMFGSTDDIPAVLIATSETVEGGVAYKGILDISWKGHYEGRFEISLIAIDEAHFVFDWGGRFREAFDKLNCLAISFPSVPILALTATLPIHQEVKMANEILRDPIIFSV